MQKTKVIRVFIAASENLAEVKTAVFDLLNQLNRHFLPRGIAFVPTLPTESATDGDLAVVLYWKDFGDLPKVEFEQAYEVFKKEAQPKIYVFFREPAPDAMEALKAFRDSFATKYGHFYCHFETVDSVKFQMTVQAFRILFPCSGKCPVTCGAPGRSGRFPCSFRIGQWRGWLHDRRQYRNGYAF